MGCNRDTEIGVGREGGRGEREKAEGEGGWQTRLEAEKQRGTGQGGGGFTRGGARAANVEGAGVLRGVPWTSGEKLSGGGAPAAAARFPRGVPGMNRLRRRDDFPAEVCCQCRSSTGNGLEHDSFRVGAASFLGSYSCTTPPAQTQGLGSSQGESSAL